MPVGSPNLKIDLMIDQFGPKPPPRGIETTHAPLHSFHNEYTATSPDAMQVPMAAPLVPNEGIGPSPRISKMLRTRLSRVMLIPSIIGVRASPAERNAPLS